MIPKIIHYCWFGGKPLPPLAKKCIASWKKHCPDYEIRRWDESSFDIDLFPYTKEAYQAGKYAFVTDVVRLFAISKYGGVYMDTDVEVIKSLDRFLIHPAFSGFESETKVPTGIMASEKDGVWATRELAYYKDRHFLKEDGSLDLTTNVDIISGNLLETGFQFNNTYQEHQGIIVMYPKDYFCPKDISTGKIYITDNTCTIHHFDASWLSPCVKMKRKLFAVLNRIHPALLPMLVKTKKKMMGFLGKPQ